jgi:drug/metabolite transporter (DMT)-like permease
LALTTSIIARPYPIGTGTASAWRTNIAVLAAAAFTIALFGLTPVTTRIAGTQIDGLTVGLVRTVGAGAFTIPVLAVCRIPIPRDGASWALLLISALGSFVAFPLLFSIGAQLTSAAHAGLMMATMPLITSALGLLIDRRTPRMAWFVGALVALLGETALVMMSDHGADAAATMTGDCVVLLACVMCACGFAAGGKLAARINPWAATLWAVTVASVALAPWAIVSFRGVDWAGLAPATWGALLHITVGATLLAYVSWFWALSRGGIARVAPLQLVQPVVALLFAVLLLGEHVPTQLMAAAVAIVGGVVIARRG